MPFDSAGFPPDRARPPPPPRPGGGGATVLVIVLSVLLLATPISLAACSDLVRYAQRP